jgi:hypothetical protein
MSEVVTCACGSKIRLPEPQQGRLLRCPRCKAEIGVRPEAPILTTNIAEGALVGAACPICQTAIQESENLVKCSECDQSHHLECWTEVGGCGSYGCGQAPRIQKQDAPDEPPRAAWGDTKKCPACHETIKSIALRCRYCGTDFETVDPLSMGDLRSRDFRERELKATRTQITVIFVLSVVGLLAPIMLLVCLVYVPVRNRQLVKAGPVYRILGYAALGLSVIYSILMLAFVLLDNGTT